MTTRKYVPIVALAAVMNVVCYTDRAAVSIAGPQLQNEFGFSPAQMGFVYSIFNLSYFIGQTPWGILADRYGARWLVAVAILGWSAFTGLTALAAGFASLLAIRFVFGALEAALSPAVASAFRGWVPEASRTSAFGFFLGGGRLGGAITPWIALPIMGLWGWRGLFVSLACAGVVASAAWLSFYRNPPAKPSAAVAEAAPPADWGVLLASPRLWRLLAVAFGCTFLWQFFITWFPTYLQQQLKLDGATAAFFAGLPFALGMCATWIGGLLTDAVARRFSPGQARTWVGLTGLLLAGLLLSAGIWCPAPRPAALLMAMAAAGVDLFLGSAWASALDIGGERGGAVAGLMNAASNCAGFVSPSLNGWILGRWNDWNIFLLAAVAIDLAAAALWIGVNPSPRREAPPVGTVS